MGTGPATTGDRCVYFYFIVFFRHCPAIFMRALFAHKMRDRKTIGETELIRFERYLIATAMVTPYLSLTAYFLELPGFYFSGSFIAALYGVYYYFPSAKRIDLKKRYFG